MLSFMALSRSIHRGATRCGFVIADPLDDVGWQSCWLSSEVVSRHSLDLRSLLHPEGITGCDARVVALSVQRLMRVADETVCYPRERERLERAERPMQLCYTTSRFEWMNSERCGECWAPWCIGYILRSRALEASLASVARESTIESRRSGG